MKRSTILLSTALIVLASGAPLLAQPDDPVAEAPAPGVPTVRLVEFQTAITPISALRITQAIEDAEAAGDAMVLIVLDTPGGVVDSMNGIVKRMLAAEVPVVVWVGPAGAHAASAGFFLLLAADVAAMAPGTRTGAAHTVIMGGENTEDNVMLKKANEDTAALLRSIAQRRGRNPEAAERAVFEAKAYEEQAALELGLIDLVSPSREQLLRDLEGREIRRFDDSSVTLQVAGARFVTSEFSLRHEFIEFLASPAIASILLLIGVLGLYTEFTNPGAIFPGVIGAVCLLLFAVTATVLPVSVVGILLIVLAIVLFVLEVKITSYGLLTLGGTISLTVGALMLIDGPIPELRVPPLVVLPTSLLIAGLIVVAMRLAIRAHREIVTTGVQGILAATGTVTRAVDPTGKVFVHGEIWDAFTDGAPIPAGTRVRIQRVDELRLAVTPEAAAAALDADDDSKET